MHTKFISLSKRPAVFLTLWILVLFIALVLSVFLHEVGHGLGARMEGIHVSTGFNQVGDYGKSPDDPDFRSNTSRASILGGLLGPITSWGLAILFTIWLYRFKKPSWGAMTAGALALVNGFIRAVPMLETLVSNLLGRPRLEDEVGWGLWAVMRICQPASVPPGMDFHTMLSTYPGVFRAEPIFWIPPLLSLSIGLVCLILAYRKVIRLWGKELQPVMTLIFGLSPLAVYFAFKPLQNILDRLIRINW